MKPTASYSEVVRVFGKLGITAFGGPAAHIAVMEEEVVERRGWLDRQRFLDLIGVTNLIPGPNSTEMAIHTGLVVRSWFGLLLAGSAFILPAVLLTFVFAKLYVLWGATPQAEVLLKGVKPAVIVIIAGAVWKLGKTSVRSIELALLGVFALAAFWLGQDPVITVLGTGFVGMVLLRVRRRPGLPLLLLILVGGTVRAAENAVLPSLWQLGLYFFKVGAVLFGSGYVLVAYLEEGLVGQGWVTSQQLMDAIAIGQVTPGPLLATSTFLGYLVLGWKGALAATLAIFLPSFIYVAMLRPVVPYLRKNPWSEAFLDSVNVAAVALMAAVAFRLAFEALAAWQDWTVFGLAAILLFGRKVSSPILILVCAALGAAIQWAGSW
jgi:chromate transporter